ncbi:hypothetical protein BDY24DRAFT_240796 [Mrakia frigida]|uniref:uncharacterized protein n=1 Tax=Mrakia frigida TaxID=29902 RepID=UPI003FCC0BCF
MYIPNVAGLLTSALALTGLSKPLVSTDKGIVAEGEVLDYCNKECIDDAGNSHCTKPFLISENQCYNFEWKTKGSVVSHTTLELREVKDNKNVHYYKDMNGDWVSDLSGLVYLDFIPRTGCDNTVEFKVSECKK